MRRRCQVVNFDAGVAFKNSRRRSVANGRSNRFFCRLFLFFCWSFLSSLLLLLFRNENRSPCDAILLLFFLSKKKKKTTEANSLRQEEEERRDVVIYTARLTSTIDRLFFCLFVCLFFQYFHFDRVTDAGRQKKIGRGHFVWPDKRAWPVVVLVAFHWSRPEPVTLCK